MGHPCDGFCLNGGVCEVNSISLLPSCTCPPGYMDKICCGRCLILSKKSALHHTFILFLVSNRKGHQYFPLLEKQRNLYYKQLNKISKDMLIDSFTMKGIKRLNSLLQPLINLCIKVKKQDSNFKFREQYFSFKHQQW